jgi:folate-binding protein YgfZ
MQLARAELLIISGVDAPAFAHAQFTSDVNALAVGAWQWSAWLDAQGRARHFFALLRVDDARLLAWLPLGDAAAMRSELARYVFRSKVVLEAAAGWGVHALSAAEIPSPPKDRLVTSHRDGYAIALPGTPQRIAWLAPSDAADSSAADLDAWRLQDIAAGLPLLPAEVGAQFVPQALDLERLDAIRFDKGCYPGQEIAARLHFRGGNKRHLARVRVDGAAPVPSGAAILAADAASVGQVLYASRLPTGNCEALAVLWSGQHDSASPMTTGGQAVFVIPADHPSMDVQPSGR